MKNYLTSGLLLCLALLFAGMITLLGVAAEKQNSAIAQLVKLQHHHAFVARYESSNEDNEDDVADKFLDPTDPISPLNPVSPYGDIWGMDW
jgi:uncharacterized membrane protein (GlpM family)